MFQANNDTRKFHILLAAISVAAVVARLLVCANLYSSCPLVAHPPQGVDMRTYLRYSAQILRGEYSGPLYYQPFYYVVFLPLVRLFGDGVWTVLVAQSLLGGGTVYLVGWCAALIRGRATGLIAAGLLAFAKLPLLYVSFALIATLNAFLVALLAWLVLAAMLTRSSPKTSLPLWGASGGVCAALILSRANAVTFVPAVCALIFIASPYITGKGLLQRRIATLTVFFLCCLAPMAPFCLYNTWVTGELSGPSTGGGANLALADNPESPPGTLHNTDTSRYWIATADRTPVWKRVISWAWDKPLAFAELAFRKLLLFWDSGEIYDNLELARKSISKSLPLRFSGIIPSAVLLMGFPAMLILFGKRLWRNRGTTMLSLMIGLFWLGIGLARNESRYRVTIFPLLAICAAIVAVECFKVAVRKRGVARTVLALVIAAFAVFEMFPLYRGHLEKNVLRLAYPQGVMVKLGGKTLLFDHGPRPFGGWTPVALKTGALVEKKFSESPGANATFQIPLICRKRRLKIMVNGKLFYLTPKQDGLNTFLVRGFPVRGSVVNLKLVDVPQDGVAFLVDRQRDFARTAINGEIAAGELVCRLVLPSKPPKNIRR